jgi:DNA-binding transcriptional regulator GbsR (MarR family)
MAKNKFGGAFLAFPRWVLKYLGEDSIAKVVLLTILLYMDSDTQELTTSYNHIAKMTGYSRSTVIRAMNRLISCGVLIRVHRKGKNGNISNRYIVRFDNPEIVNSTLVSQQTLGSVQPDTTGGVTTDTTPSVPRDTQSRITNNKNNQKKNLSYKREKERNETEGYEIDPTLLENK